MQKEGNDISNGRGYKPTFAMLLGEFIGTLKGIRHYELPNNVNLVLNERIAKLESIPIGYTVSKDFLQHEHKEEGKDAIELLKEYEQWEADLINDNSMWWPHAKKDAISGRTYDKMLELQEKRNNILKNNKHG